MESIQNIKNRINSIAGTRQITRSMRLVSTAKMQKARARMSAGRPCLDETLRMMQGLCGYLRDSAHPYIAGRAVRCSAVIAVSSDRGLCGGYNIAVGKEAGRLIEQLGCVKIITVGAKAADFIARRLQKKVDLPFGGILETPYYADACQIAEKALGWFDAGEVDQIYLCYTKFESMLKQYPVSVKLLPLRGEDVGAPGADIRLASLEPDGDAFLKGAVPFYLDTLIYGAMLEASACEQSARITSMDSAVKNSDEMIGSLTLLYNQARQSAVTQEIIEIVGGADAIGY